MTKNKTLTLIIIVLLAANLAQLFFHACPKKTDGEKMKGGFAGELKKTVGFSDAQLERFQQLKEVHWAQAKEQLNNIHAIKQRLLELSRQDAVQDSTAKLLADSIGTLQSRAEMHIYHHLHEVRKICTPQQLPQFDMLMKKISVHPHAPHANAPKS